MQIYVADPMQSGILKRIEEKENERDSFELQISNVDLSHLDERERNMVLLPIYCYSRILCIAFLYNAAVSWLANAFVFTAAYRCGKKDKAACWKRIWIKHTGKAEWDI